MPFKLSTSQTPNRMSELRSPMDFSYTGGAFGPSAADGYGVSYIFSGDDQRESNVPSYFH